MKKISVIIKFQMSMVMNGIFYNHKNTTKNEINICENMILDEIVLNASNSQNNYCFTNNKEVELYDLVYEHCS
jgi:hypothetical protein